MWRQTFAFSAMRHFCRNRALDCLVISLLSVHLRNARYRVVHLAINNCVSLTEDANFSMPLPSIAPRYKALWPGDCRDATHIAYFCPSRDRLDQVCGELARGCAEPALGITEASEKVSGTSNCHFSGFTVHFHTLSRPRCGWPSGSDPEGQPPFTTTFHIQCTLPIIPGSAS